MSAVQTHMWQKTIMIAYQQGERQIDLRDRERKIPDKGYNIILQEYRFVLAEEIEKPKYFLCIQE